MVCCTAAEGREGSIVEKRKKRNGCLGIIICSLVLYYRSTTSIARLRFSQYIKRFTQKKASSLDATQREDVPADDCLNHHQRNLYFFLYLFFSLIPLWLSHSLSTRQVHSGADRVVQMIILQLNPCTPESNATHKKEKGTHF